MRKSYEGHIKPLGLAGKNKPVKHEVSMPGMGLMEMAMWPEEEWRNQKVLGKDLSQGLSSALKARLGKAMKMSTKPSLRTEEWNQMLSLDKPKLPPLPEAKGKLNIQTTKTKSNGSIITNSKASTTPIDDRPKRANAKRRRYGDDSYEGYGEGYIDDDAMEDVDNESSLEGSRKGNPSKKKRRKVS